MTTLFKLILGEKAECKDIFMSADPCAIGQKQISKIVLFESKQIFQSNLYW